MNSPGCGGLCIVISGNPHNPSSRLVRLQIQTLSASYHLPKLTSDHAQYPLGGEGESREYSYRQSTEPYQGTPVAYAIASHGVAEYLPQFPIQRTSSALCAGTIESRKH